MESYIHDFTSRQHMVTPDYEYFHYRDSGHMDIAYHNHDFYEIYLFCSGNVTYLVEGRSYKLQPGDILLIHNRELHKPQVTDGEPYERRVLWVSPEYLLRKSDKNSNLAMCFESRSMKNYNLIRPSQQMNHKIYKTLERFEYALSSLSYGSSILKGTFLVEYLVNINLAFLEEYDSTESPDIQYNTKINDIIRHINGNLQDDLSLDSISRKFYLSKYHLTRQFKKFTGYTLHKYIRHKRLIKAKGLLREGRRIDEVCYKCGFNDYSNFIRAFKKTYGLPPGKYAQKKILK